MAISMAAPKALAVALDSEELKQFGEADSFSKREEITRIVAIRLKQKSTADWLPSLEAAKIWHAPVQDYRDLVSDPQLNHLGVFKTAESAGGVPIRMVAHPARYDGQTPEVRLVPQRLGAQTREVLGEIGYGAAAIDAMIAGKAVGVAR
jgi:crotonobetainyl-CoA:carnitine CoA-transferase CaiB-like acyl-CoA transferase